MASKYWLKLYHEMVDDPKIARLPDSSYRRFIECLLLAGELDEDGFLPSVEDMAWRLRLNETSLSQDLSRLALAGMVELKQFDDNTERWFVTNFSKRQSPASGTERSRQSRAKSQGAEKKPGNKSRETWRTKIYKALPTSGGIYEIICVPTGMRYIGGSINIQERIKSHLSEMSTAPDHPMKDAFKEYGHKNIRVNILESVNDSALLAEREAHWQSIYEPQELYNKDRYGKTHRGWGGVADDATIRCIDTDIDEEEDIDTEEDEERYAPTKQEAFAFSLFEGMAGFPPPDYSTSEFNDNWLVPIRAIIKASANHTEIEDRITYAVGQMRGDSGKVYTIKSPKSILTFAMNWGSEKRAKANGHLNGRVMEPDMSPERKGGAY